MSGHLYRFGSAASHWSLLRRVDDFGIAALDLVRPPGRFWADATDEAPPLIQLNVDSNRAAAIPSPAQLLSNLPVGETWTGHTKRSRSRLFAWFLLCEDAQRRLDVQVVETLAHQASLVRHVLETPSLQRVLVADEVGLGKTIEAGLILKELLAQKPGMRVLYLAPARLVANVRREFDRLELRFRSWVAGNQADARLDDPRVLASIHKASWGKNQELFTRGPLWDVIVVDEAHHVSAWEPEAGSPVEKYKLVRDLAERLGPEGRLILLTGTPHQGHPERFKNLLRLLGGKDEPAEELAGRVIYRTKEDVRDWDGSPLFPRRQVNPPIPVDLGPAHHAWLESIHRFFEPRRFDDAGDARRRAAGWRAGQALQWATSSIEAGLGYLVRQAVRGGLGIDGPGVRAALAALRPYRNGSPTEPLESLWARIEREVGIQAQTGSIEDLEVDDDPTRWRPDPIQLGSLLDEGLALLRSAGDLKWELLQQRVLDGAGDEKVVLFAQPIETVNALVTRFEKLTGKRPAVIAGGQADAERTREIESFWRPNGPQYLVSSKAGGEGLNLQVARRLVHLDVPWNPMDMEQRVGRVHRFLSRKTIIVDTLVVKHSREMDAYSVARSKLQDISRTLRGEDNFESLFSRVMALVPPEELQDVLVDRPSAPLNDEERARLSRLVQEGFDRWREFHTRYSSGRQSVQELDPGAAEWLDLERFAVERLRARPASGFTSLRFAERDGEVQEVSGHARVFEIGDRAYSLGEAAGVPVLDAEGRAAQRLGLNTPEIARALREVGLPAEPTGAAHLRLPEGVSSFESWAPPFGVVALARQQLRFGVETTEAGSELRLFVVGEGSPEEVSGARKRELVHLMMDATVRMDADPNSTSLAARVANVEAELRDQLRRPDEAQRANRIAHAVTPLFAAIVTR